MTGVERRANIVAFIRRFHAAHGFGPSVREIAAGVGLASAARAHEHLCRLVEEGRVERRQVATNFFVWAIPNE